MKSRMVSEMAAAAWQDGIFAWEWDAWGMIVEP